MKKILVLTSLTLLGLIFSCTQIPLQTEPDWYINSQFNDNMYYGVRIGESKIQALVGALEEIQSQNHLIVIIRTFPMKSDSTSLGTSIGSSSEVIIHPNITLIGELEIIYSETYEEDARVFKNNIRHTIYFKYDMNGNVYEYEEHFEDYYDGTKHKSETTIRKDSSNVKIEDIIDDLIAFGYDFKHHQASNAHYILLGINKDTIIDLNKGISKEPSQKLEELSPEAQAKFDEMEKRLNIE